MKFIINYFLFSFQYFLANSKINYSFTKFNLNFMQKKFKVFLLDFLNQNLPIPDFIINFKFSSILIRFI